MSYASPSDVATRLGRTLTTAEVAQAQQLLDDAEAMIRVRVPNLDAQITAGTIDMQTIARVEANAVRRVLINPSGIRSHSEGLGDFTQSDTFDSSVSTGELYIDDAAFGDLEGSQAAFTIRPAYSPGNYEASVYRPWSTNPTPWLDWR